MSDSASPSDSSSTSIMEPCTPTHLKSCHPPIVLLVMVSQSLATVSWVSCQLLLLQLRIRPLRLRFTFVVLCSLQWRLCRLHSPSSHLESEVLEVISWVRVWRIGEERIRRTDFGCIGLDVIPHYSFTMRYEMYFLEFSYQEHLSIIGPNRHGDKVLHGNSSGPLT